MELGELSGLDIGGRTIRYSDRDVMLYALGVLAPPDRLELVYENNLRVLPTFALTLGLWAVEAAGSLGAYDPKLSLHVAQSLHMKRSLPVDGSMDLTGRVGDVIDKGKATTLDVMVEGDYFSAVYTIYLPGTGNWGGPTKPTPRLPEPSQWASTTTVHVRDDQAALYRLTGDRHPVHIDPAVARQSGFDRPILHGLCTLGIVAREIADLVPVEEARLRDLEVRFTAPAFPGDTLVISTTEHSGDGILFKTTAGERSVLSGGVARFG